MSRTVTMDHDDDDVYCTIAAAVLLLLLWTYLCYYIARGRFLLKQSTIIEVGCDKAMVDSTNKYDDCICLLVDP